MTGHQGAITSLSFSAESSVLVSGGLDSTVRCWDVKSAGGTKSSSMRQEGESAARRSSGQVNNVELGSIPMGDGDAIEEGTKQTSVIQSFLGCLVLMPYRSDLLSTFHTKRTPVMKTHYTPRNLCMVAGAFVPPSNVPTKGHGVEAAA